MQTDEMIGIECEVCHNEAFHVTEREVTITAKCCPRCVARIDFGNEEQTTRDAIKTMERTERRQLFKEKSFEWANNLHGKKVMVYWDGNTHPVNMRYFEHNVRGTSYRTTNESGGWGKVKVVIDPSEHYRIDLEWTYSIEYGTGKHCPYQKPIIDGQKYGLYLNLDADGSWYTLVSWGSRKTLVQQ